MSDDALLDALDRVYSTTVWLVNSRPPPTGDRISYDDGFGRGVVAAAERIQHEVVSIMPDFHDRIAARDAAKTA